MPGIRQKSTKELELSGYFERHPERLRARLREPKPGGALGDPPAHFSVKKGHEGYEQAAELTGIWHEIASMCPWLTSGDRHTVEDVCELRWRARHRVISPTERNTLRQLSSLCGLDSVGRARLGTELPESGGAPSEDPRDAFERETREMRAKEQDRLRAL